MAKPSKIVVEAQQARIKPEEILYLVTEMGKRHEAGESTDFTAQAMILLARYPKSSRKNFAIIERMLCLAKMMKDQRMRGWSIEVPDRRCSDGAGH